MCLYCVFCQPCFIDLVINDPILNHDFICQLETAFCHSINVGVSKETVGAQDDTHKNQTLQSGYKISTGHQPKHCQNMQVVDIFTLLRSQKDKW